MAPNTPDSRPEDAPTTRGLRPNQKVGAGRFTLVSPLGEGGMGVVWKAADATLGGMVALKFLPFEISADPTAIEDLRRETAQSRRLSHPHIVRVYDLYEDITPFIYMEYVEGHTLSHERVRHPRRILPWSFLAPYVAQLCEALDHAHRERIVHRDLKPGNVLLDPQRAIIKLVDFGIARVISESVTRVTMKKPAEGTIVYMSCQQLNGEAASPADDIYSLGVTIYELLTSKPPFHSGDTAWQIRYGEIAPITQRLTEFNLDNDVPPHVEKAVMACLSRDPFKRPATARDVAEQLGLLDYRAGRSRTNTPRPTPRPPEAGTEDEDPPGDALPEGEEPEPVPTARPSPRRPTSTRRVPRTTPEPAASRSSLGPILMAVALLAGVATGVVLMRNTRKDTAAPPHPGETAGTPAGTSSTPAIVPLPPPGPGVSSPQTAESPSHPEPPTSASTAATQPASTLQVPGPVALTNPPATVVPPPPTVATQEAVAATAPPPPTPPAPEPQKSPLPGSAWTNTLGMRFVPVPGQRALFSTWETRIADYRVFARTAGTAAGTRWSSAAGPDSDHHPVASVTWSNAVAFCQWLTQAERTAGCLEPNQSYRLPTDAEWSAAAGLESEGRGSPIELSKRQPAEHRFAWGSDWPPPAGSANLCGAEVGRKNPGISCIRGYDDGYTTTSPVGHFQASDPHALHDLTGNVAEWCADLHQPNQPHRVVRGGSYGSFDAREIRLRDRQYEAPATQKPSLGFRCVLDTSAPAR